MALGQPGWNRLRSLPSLCSLPLGGFVASEVSRPAWPGAASSAFARGSQHTLEQTGCSEPYPAHVAAASGLPCTGGARGLEQLLLLLCTLG